MTEGLTSGELRLLQALAGMALQYLGDERGGLDNMCMGAGELAFEVLAEHGLIEVFPGNRVANWTPKGNVFLDSY